MGAAQNEFLTRLHVPLQRGTFPWRPYAQKTSDRGKFQARYAFGTLGPGTDDCAAATAYRQQIRVRYKRETHTLASLTVAYR